MKVAPLYEVKNRLSRYVSETEGGPLIITKNGKPAAALVTLVGEDLEAFVLAHSPRFRRLMDEAVAEAKQAGRSLSEVGSQLGHFAE